MARKLIVEVVGDTRNFDRALKRSSKNAQTFSTNFRKQAFAAGAGFIGAQSLEQGIRSVTGAMKQSVLAASDLNEQLSKTRAVFGDATTQVEDWAKTTTDAFGISRRQALATASSFGALFAPLGLVGRTAATQAQRLTELGADLASFYNTNVQDALDAIRSGLVGEAEPLRRYGVLLSESRVQQQALVETGKRHVTQLTAQEKALARITLIFKDTAQARGDVARTQGNLAGQMRKFNAQVDDLSTNLGQLLIPALTNATTAANGFLDQLNRGDALGAFKDGLTSIGNLWLSEADLLFPGKLDRLGHDRGKEIGENFAAGFGEGFFVQGPMRASALEEAAARAAKAAAAKTVKARPGVTGGQRNSWFDAMISRQLDRVQDLGLRGQAARLRQIAQEVRARLAVTKDATRRLTLEDRLLEILREQKSVQAQIGDEIRAANDALKDRADAIKSAVLDRLQARQTDILNKRALADAKEQLRIARQIGGPEGIRAARRTLQDVNMDILMARLSRAPATLTKGGQFALGNVVTINIHGVTDPEAVARKVAEVLQRRQRRTTTQSRGPAAGTAAGAH